MPDVIIDDYTFGDEETIKITIFHYKKSKKTIKRVVKLPLLSSANGPMAYIEAILADKGAFAQKNQKNKVCEALEKIHGANGRQLRAAYLELIGACVFFTGKENPYDSSEEKGPAANVEQAHDAKQSGHAVSRHSFMAKCGSQLQWQAAMAIHQIDSTPRPGPWWQRFFNWIASFFADEENAPPYSILDDQLKAIAAHALGTETPDQYLRAAYEHRHPHPVDEKKQHSPAPKAPQHDEFKKIDNYTLFTAYQKSNDTELKNKISHSCLGIRFYQSSEREQKFFNLPKEDRFDTLLQLLDLYQVSNAFEFLNTQQDTEIADINQAIRLKKLDFAKKYGKFVEAIGPNGEGYPLRGPATQTEKTKDETILGLIEELLLNKTYLEKYRQWLRTHPSFRP